ncbi:putative colanic acid biosysnthesis UDP-glucose lipid carrier transferase [Dyadobacter koreensis]|uniref:Putative colanic acid biosysnthesis UDP-glucose lipid carrier transferase n=1 Tax=Dyadobacter koreensis TaxID=408657 RepID=A0A1H6Q8X6_9BACT|nr:exopolysaccharide biosynthesis polyprenyl glycosylphosphotransferase [Dyadobacter koreensis]SEI40261.1 putative colanic acid biosysnthesis UDP-glucose lipid carrier transferase [Dyadobacter koreensis]
MLTDILLLSGSYLFFFLGKPEFTERHLLFLLNYCALWMIVGYFTRIYYIHLHNSYQYRLMMYLRAHLVFIGILSFLFLLNEALIPINRYQLINFAMTFMVIELFSHYVIVQLIGQMRLKGKNVRRALIVGEKEIGEKINSYFKNNLDLGYNVVGILDSYPAGPNSKTNRITALEEMVAGQRIDEIIIANYKDDVIKEVIMISDYHGIRTRIVPNFSTLLGKNFSISQLGNIPIVNVRESSLDNLYWAAQKRLFDVIFSLLALIGLAPIFALVAIAIRLESKGKIFYCPTRMGQGGRGFEVFKFRSMYEGDGGNGTLSTSANDPRITKVGAFIRKYSLDELPQFLNVLRGDMSVVGPRPHRMFLNQVMQKEVDNYMVRHYLKPGITGWAQVNGWRGPTDTKEQKLQRTKHDLWYLDNWTFALDLKIIFMTVFSKKTHQNVF